MMAASLLGFVALLASTAGPFRSVAGRGVPAGAANARLWSCTVPDEATDVWFTSSYRATRIECTLEPAGFEAWCARSGWRPAPTPSGVPIDFFSERDGLREIRRGRHFEARRTEVGFVETFDGDARRAYVTFSGG